MNLSERSWHARLWYLSYGKHKYLPTNLCPYFWAVFSAVILILPVILFELALIVYVKVYNEVSDSHEDILEDNGLINPIPISIGIVFNTIAFVLISMIGMWFTLDSKKSPFNALGILGWGVFVALTIRHFYLIVKDKRKQRKGLIVEDNKPNIFVEFVKAKYKKHCPIINWSEDDESNIDKT